MNDCLFLDISMKVFVLHFGFASLCCSLSFFLSLSYFSPSLHLCTFNSLNYRSCSSEIPYTQAEKTYFQAVHFCLWSASVIQCATCRREPVYVKCSLPKCVIMDTYVQVLFVNCHGSLRISQEKIQK